MEYDSFLGFSSPDNPSAQIVTTQPGVDAPLPRFGIDVGSPEAVDAIHADAAALDVVVRYGPTTEPWGIRRCFLQDPTGAVISILAHTDTVGGGSSVSATSEKHDQPGVPLAR